MALIINLFGGPGCRKSTTAAHLFALMKWDNVNCEYVPEYAKELTWEENHTRLKDQVHILGEQHRRMFDKLHKVDAIVTDSPVLLGALYDKTDNDKLEALIVRQFFKLSPMINIMVRRKAKYNPDGRYQTEEEAKILDNQVEKMLKKYDIAYEEAEGTREYVERTLHLRVMREIDKYRTGKL